MNEKAHLFPRQRALLREIERFIKHRGYPPTLRELAAAVGVSSPSGIRQQLKALERRGILALTPRRPRGIVLRRSRPKSEPIPILGQIAAGSPIDAEELDGRYLALDSSMGIASDRCFAVRVEGESMIEEHIMGGDFVVLDPTAEASTGSVVAVAVDGAVTLKRYHPTKKGVELRPANRQMESIFLEPGKAHDARIVGVAVAVIRALTGGAIR
jgi:repressor LexA